MSSLVNWRFHSLKALLIKCLESESPLVSHFPQMTQLSPWGRICLKLRITLPAQRVTSIFKRLFCFHSLSSKNNLYLWKTVFCSSLLLVPQTIEEIHSLFSLLYTLNTNSSLRYHLPLGVTFIQEGKGKWASLLLF